MWINTTEAETESEEKRNVLIPAIPIPLSLRIIAIPSSFFIHTGSRDGAVADSSPVVSQKHPSRSFMSRMLLALQ